MGRESGAPFTTVDESPLGKLLIRMANKLDELYENYGLEKDSNVDQTPEFIYAKVQLIALKEIINTIKTRILPSFDSGKKPGFWELSNLKQQKAVLDKLLLPFRSPKHLFFEALSHEFADVVELAMNGMNTKQKTDSEEENKTASVTRLFKSWSNFRGSPVKEKKQAEAVDSIHKEQGLSSEIQRDEKFKEDNYRQFRDDLKRAIRHNSEERFATLLSIPGIDLEPFFTELDETIEHQDFSDWNPVFEVNSPELITNFLDALGKTIKLNLRTNQQQMPYEYWITHPMTYEWAVELLNELATLPNPMLLDDFLSFLDPTALVINTFTFPLTVDYQPTDNNRYVYKARLSGEVDKVYNLEQVCNDYRNDITILRDQIGRYIKQYPDTEHVKGEKSKASLMVTYIQEKLLELDAKKQQLRDEYSILFENLVLKEMTYEESRDALTRQQLAVQTFLHQYKEFFEQQESLFESSFETLIASCPVLSGIIEDLKSNLVDLSCLNKPLPDFIVAVDTEMQSSDVVPVKKALESVFVAFNDETLEWKEKLSAHEALLKEQHTALMKEWMLQESDKHQKASQVIKDKLQDVREELNLIGKREPLPHSLRSYDAEIKEIQNHLDGIASKKSRLIEITSAVQELQLAKERESTFLEGIQVVTEAFAAEIDAMYYPLNSMFAQVYEDIEELDKLLDEQKATAVLAKDKAISNKAFTKKMESNDLSILKNLLEEKIAQRAAIQKNSNDLSKKLETIPAALEREELRLLGNYDLNPMSDGDLAINIIEFLCTEKGFVYRVYEFGQVNSDIIAWQDLPKNFPRDEKIILANKKSLLPTLLKITTKYGHTQMGPQEGLTVSKNSQIDKLKIFKKTAAEMLHLLESVEKGLTKTLTVDNEIENIEPSLLMSTLKKFFNYCEERWEQHQSMLNYQSLTEKDCKGMDAIIADYKVLEEILGFLEEQHTIPFEKIDKIKAFGNNLSLSNFVDIKFKSKMHEGFQCLFNLLGVKEETEIAAWWEYRTQQSSLKDSSKELIEQKMAAFGQLLKDRLALFLFMQIYPTLRSSLTQQHNELSQLEIELSLLLVAEESATSKIKGIKEQLKSLNNEQDAIKQQLKDNEQTSEILDLTISNISSIVSLLEKTESLCSEIEHMMPLSDVKLTMELISELNKQHNCLIEDLAELEKSVKLKPNRKDYKPNIARIKALLENGQEKLENFLGEYSEKTIINYENIFNALHQKVTKQKKNLIAFQSNGKSIKDNIFDLSEKLKSYADTAAVVIIHSEQFTALDSNLVAMKYPDKIKKTRESFGSIKVQNDELQVALLEQLKTFLAKQIEKPLDKHIAAINAIEFKADEALYRQNKSSLAAAKAFLPDISGEILNSLHSPLERIKPASDELLLSLESLQAKVIALSLSCSKKQETADKVSILIQERKEWVAPQKQALDDYLLERSERFHYKDILDNNRDNLKRGKFIIELKAALDTYASDGEVSVIDTLIKSNRSDFRGRRLPAVLNRLSTDLRTRDRLEKNPKEGPAIDHDEALNILQGLVNPYDKFAESMNNLYQKINVMYAYGQSLSEKNPEAAEVAQNLALRLGEQVDRFVIIHKDALNPASENFGLTAEDIKAFKDEFSALLHSQDDKMNELRSNWKSIVVNILAAVSSIGIAVVWKLWSSKNNQGYASFFMDKTKGMETIEKVDEALDEVIEKSPEPLIAAQSY